MADTSKSYDPEADFAATGSVLCDDCGARVRPRTLESLPPHRCAERQRQSRRTCLTGALVGPVPVICDRRDGHDGLHRDSDADLTWPRATDVPEEG